MAFWQSPVANAFIRERISGDEEVSPASFFAGLTDESVRGGPALSLRAGDTKLECELLRLGACARMTILAETPERLEYVGARIPDELRTPVHLEHAEPLEFTPPEPLAIVVANSALHRSPDPDALVTRIGEWLVPGGMVYVDEFVGPDRFQWTDAQIEIVNQLLASLPEELRRDLASETGGPKSEIGRPDPQRFARDHPTEAVASERIRAALDANLEAVALRPYGGAIYHQLFARIMGNFAGHPELVRTILSFDAILSERGVVDSDYLWAAYRKPS
jgi:SAM-dependent methyltransferase